MATEENIIPQFFIDAVQNNYKSEQEGRPIHEDREFIRILIAGDSRSEVVREVLPNDKERFREQYRRFRDGLKEDEQLTGTRLKEWPAMTPASIRDFNGINVFTVEQIAGMSDVAVGNFGMGGLEWRAKAKAYLEAAEKGATASHYAAENERLRADIERLSSQVRELASQIDPEKRGPGRPRKEAA